MKELKNRPKGSGNKQSYSQKRWANLFTFHPTAMEREELKSIPTDTEKDLDYLSTYLEAGCTLSLGMRQDTGSYYTTLRVKTDDWQTAPAVAAWHNELAKAVKALAYAMRYKLENWPETLPKQVGDDLDW